MEARSENRIYWELTYIVMLTVLIIVLAATVRELSQWIAVSGFIACFTLNCGVWRMPVSRNVFYLHNGLNILCALLLSYILYTYLFITDSVVTGAVLGVVAMDVISFTKHGRFTLNAKLISQKYNAARLSICLPVPGKRGLIPVIGAGDLLFYSLLTIESLQMHNRHSPFIAVLPILAGQILNIIIILALKNRPGYKGFPATLMPGLLFVTFLLLNIQA